MTPRPRKRDIARPAIGFAIVLAVALAASATAMSLAAPADARGEPANFVRWRPGLSSSAQPSAIYLARVKALGYDAVINLAPPRLEEVH